MSNSGSLFDAAVSAVAEERLKEESWHPSQVDLAAFLEERLPESELERIESHIAICRACADSTLDLAEPQPDTDLAQLEQPVTTGSGPAGRPFYLTARFAAMLAAVSFLTLLGVVLWPRGPGDVPVSASMPANLALIFLEREDDSGAAVGPRDAALANERLIRDEAPAIVLSLAYVEDRDVPFQSYRVLIQPVGAGAALEYPDVVLNLDHNFTVPAAAADMPDGGYQVSVWGNAGGTEEPVARYAFTLRRVASAR